MKSRQSVKVLNWNDSEANLIEELLEVNATMNKNGSERLDRLVVTSPQLQALLVNKHVQGATGKTMPLKTFARDRKDGVDAKEYAVVLRAIPWLTFVVSDTSEFPELEENTYVLKVA